MSEQPIPVGLGEIKISGRQESILVCYGLGSCIGLILYDPLTRIGGMAHVVLPDSALGRGKDLAGKFADTAVPTLIEEVIRLGAVRARLLARIAGGARMLNVIGAGSRLDIGARNTEAVKAALDSVRLTLVAEDTGGSHGRTVHLYMDTGKVIVSTVGRGEKVL